MWMYSARGSTVPMWSLYNWPVLLCHWLIFAAGRARIAEIGGQGGVYADRQCGAVPHFGLPTQRWNWDAMFRGRMAGKGSLPGRMNCDAPLPLFRWWKGRLKPVGTWWWLWSTGVCFLPSESRFCRMRRSSHCHAG